MARFGPYSSGRLTRNSSVRRHTYLVLWASATVEKFTKRPCLTLRLCLVSSIGLVGLVGVDGLADAAASDRRACAAQAFRVERLLPRRGGSQRQGACRPSQLLSHLGEVAQTRVGTVSQECCTSEYSPCLEGHAQCGCSPCLLRPFLSSNGWQFTVL